VALHDGKECSLQHPLLQRNAGPALALASHKSNVWNRGYGRLSDVAAYSYLLYCTYIFASVALTSVGGGQVWRCFDAACPPAPNESAVPANHDPAHSPCRHFVVAKIKDSHPNRGAIQTPDDVGTSITVDLLELKYVHHFPRSLFTILLKTKTLPFPVPKTAEMIPQPICPAATTKYTNFDSW